MIARCRRESYLVTPLTENLGVEVGGFSPQDFGIGRLFKHVRDAIVVANAQTERIVLWNACAGAMFGYDEAQALALPLHALVPENLRDLHRTGLARYQETGGGNLIERGDPVELKGVHKAGHEIPIELTLTRIPERTASGDRFVLAIIRDITERKNAELANLQLKESATDRRRALELNDTIVQGLAVAKLAFEQGEHEMGLRSVTDTLKQAQRLVTRLLGQIETAEGPLKPGDFVIQSEDEQSDN